MELQVSQFFFLEKVVVEKSEIDWEYIETGFDYDFDQIATDQNGKLFTVGGDNWNYGLLGTSIDGQNWNFDSLTNKRMYDISFDRQGNGYAVGIDGYLFHKDVNSNDWKFHRLPSYIVNRGVSFWNKSQGFIAAGAAFGNGRIHKIIEPFEREKQDTFDYEISDITHSNSQTIHAAGYGLILKSKDQGATWQRSFPSGDYFKAIQFVDENTGYVIGFSGSILRTDDAGESWQSLKKGGNLNSSKEPFTDLFFEDKNNGFITGEDGLLWETRDGGSSWIKYTNLPKDAFTGIAISGSHGYLSGEEGKLVRFLIP